MDKELDVVYEDNHVIVAIKPQNMPTQQDESKDIDMLSMVKEYIKTKYNKPGNVYVGLVHRLDRPTGGLLVFAKTSKAASRLSEEIKNGQMSKKYLAVVEGCPKEKTKKLEHYLKKDEKNNIVKIVPMSEDGAKKAELIYNVLETDSDYIEVEVPAKSRSRIDEYKDVNEEPEQKTFIEKRTVNTLSLVEVELLTGRSHQIRVQMASLKTPLFGDAKYNKKLVEKNESSNNLALWAYELTFIHPTTKQVMSFKSLPPEENMPWNKFNLKNK